MSYSKIEKEVAEEVAEEVPEEVAEEVAEVVAFLVNFVENKVDSVEKQKETESSIIAVQAYRVVYPVGTITKQPEHSSPSCNRSIPSTCNCCPIGINRNSSPLDQPTLCCCHCSNTDCSQLGECITYTLFSPFYVVGGLVQFLGLCLECCGECCSNC